MHIHSLNHEITVLADHLEVPGLGFLPVNAFVLGGSQPLVVDTGLGLPDRDFVSSVKSVMDPAQVRWIWLTHPDRDHTGGLFALLDAAPQAVVVTTFLGLGIMSTTTPLPLDRVYLLNPGETLDLGDRRLRALRPPLFDNPATVGFLDDRSGAFFCSDCFGAPFASAGLASAEDISVVPSDDLRKAQQLWATVDSPWVHMVDQRMYDDELRRVRDTSPSSILSSHLPPAFGQTSAFLEMLAAVPHAPPFVGPNQQALQQMLAAPESAPAPLEASRRGEPAQPLAPS